MIEFLKSTFSFIRHVFDTRGLEKENATLTEKLANCERKMSELEREKKALQSRLKVPERKLDEATRSRHQKNLPPETPGLRKVRDKDARYLRGIVNLMRRSSLTFCRSKSKRGRAKADDARRVWRSKSALYAI